MSDTVYHYETPSNGAHGKMTLEMLRSLAGTGRIGTDVLVSRTANGPWRKLSEVMDDKCVPKAPRGAPRARTEYSVATALGWVGLAAVGMGIFGICNMIWSIAFHAPKTPLPTTGDLIAAMSGIIYGMMLMGFGEVIRYLRRIAEK